MTRTELTREFLKSVLSYDPETVVFTWKKRSDVPKEWNTRRAGKQAGFKEKNKHTFYIRIRINKRIYYSHRLAWLYMTGSFPESGLQIDHIHGNGLNNRFANLRVVTNRQNTTNSRVYKSNQLGIRGVDKFAGRYRATIQKDGKGLHLGYFDTPEEASVAYQKAAEELFGDYRRAG